MVGRASEPASASPSPGLPTWAWVWYAPSFSLTTSLLPERSARSSVFHSVKNLVGVPVVPYLQPFGIIACEHELYGGEESFVENFFLVGTELLDGIGDPDRMTFQFEHTDGDAVDVDDDVGATFVATAKCYLFSNRKVVLVWVVPVN